MQMGRLRRWNARMSYPAPMSRRRGFIVSLELAVVLWLVVQINDHFDDPFFDGVVAAAMGAVVGFAGYRDSHRTVRASWPQKLTLFVTTIILLNVLGYEIGSAYLFAFAALLVLVGWQAAEELLTRRPR